MSEHAGSGTLAWGIIGTGGIAHRFAGAVGTSRTGRLAAVASRTQASADKFGDEFGIPKRYEGYDALLADPEVQAVYISLPNHLHAEWTVRCAEAGKHILCEKPLATNYAEALVAVEAARRNGVFLMEAFMYRCHPQTRALADRIREGAIGEVRVIQANFAFNMRGPRPENVRQQNPAAGGGIMDVGCYCASMARLVAGAAAGDAPAEAEVVKGVGYINPTNRVDEWATAAVRFPGDIVANLTCGIQVGVQSAVRVWGSEGHIVVTNPWFPDRPDAKVLVYRNGQEAPEEIVAQGEVPLYSIEADMVAEAVAAGRQQATYPCMTWEDSLANMRLLDAWRQEIGLVFDNETSEGLERPFAGRPLRREPDAPMRYGQVEGVTAPVSRIVMGSMVFRTGGLRLACALLDDYFRAGGRTIDTSDLADHAGRSLPSYMVPASLMVLDALPLNTSGKLDRKALPQPTFERTEDFREPVTDAEKEVAGAFGEVLGLDRVGLDDDFFALGGNSLVAAQVVSRIGSALDVQVAVRTLFEASTVVALAARVAGGPPCAARSASRRPGNSPTTTGADRSALSWRPSSAGDTTAGRSCGPSTTSAPCCCSRPRVPCPRRASRGSWPLSAATPC